MKIYFFTLRITKERDLCSRGMENGGTTFCGMSSVNEYWSRVSETDRSEIKTSSSDDSADESESSSKEYRDASCYVDFDEEVSDIVDENASKLVEKPRKNVKFSESDTEDDSKLETSRYVRWDVLMSLGLGLWAVLCIVDSTHSKMSLTRDWFFESAREKKNVSKTVLVKRSKSDVWWFFHFCSYLWRLVWYFSSGGAYILVILLLIVFCADPRLRKAVGQATIINNMNTSVAGNELKKSIVQNKNRNKRKKRQNSRGIHSVIPKMVPMNLVISPAIHLHAKFLSSIEQRLSDGQNTLQGRNFIVKRGVSNVSTIFQQSNHHLSDCGKSFTANQSLLGQIRVSSFRTLKFSNVSRKDADSVAKASASMFLMESSSTSTCSIRKINIKVEEYLRKTRKCSNSVNSLRARNFDSRRISAELTTNGETRTRIITSSPAFKNFLLRLRHNSCVS